MRRVLLGLAVLLPATPGCHLLREPGRPAGDGVFSSLANNGTNGFAVTEGGFSTFEQQGGGTLSGMGRRLGLGDGGSPALAFGSGRDRSRQVSTSPTVDPLLDAGAAYASDDRADRAGRSLDFGDDFPGAGTRAPEPFPQSVRDPLLAGDDPPRPPRPAVTDDQTRFAGAQSPAAVPEGSPGADYSRARRRLERSGAWNIQLEEDPQTGRTSFQCQVPYPGDPQRQRMFQVDDIPPNAEAEVAAMDKVADAIDAWLNEQQSPADP